MSKATGTYPAYVAASPPLAPAPSASAPQQAVINSQGQNLPPSSDQFQARLHADTTEHLLRFYPGACWWVDTSRFWPPGADALVAGRL